MAIRALALVGRAILDQDFSAAGVLPERLTALLADHPRLIARAVSMLGTLCEMDGEEVLPDVLYARSAYQLLVDAEQWPAPPLDKFHLDESDEEIHALMARVDLRPDEMPRHVPPGHTWWPAAGGEHE